MAAQTPSPTARSGWADSFRIPFPGPRRLDPRIRDHGSPNRERFKGAVFESFRVGRLQHPSESSVPSSRPPRPHCGCGGTSSSCGPAPSKGRRGRKALSKSYQIRPRGEI